MTAAAPAAHLHPGLLSALRAVGEVVHALAAEYVAAGAAPADPFRGLHVDSADVERLLAQGIVGSTIDIQGEPLGRFVLPPEAEGSPLGIAAHVLRLSAFETAVVALCLLSELDGRYASIFGFLHDDVTRKEPTIDLALKLFAPPGVAGLDYLGCFSASATLASWRVLRPLRDEPLVSQSLGLDRSFLWFLLCEQGVDPSLAGVAQLWSEPMTDVQPGDLAPFVMAQINAGTTVLLHGLDEQACLHTAAAAAARLDRPLLVIDGAKLAESDDAGTLLQQCLRECVLRGWCPCVTAATTLLQQNAARADACRQRLLASPVPSVLIGGVADGVSAYAGAGVLPVAVPAPRALDRLAYWQAAATTAGAVLDDYSLLAFAETEGLSGRTIDDVLTVAAASAAAAGEALDVRHVQTAARGALRGRAPTLQLSAPRFTWQDIVLPPDRLQVLQHLVSRIRHRSQVRTIWGLGEGTLPGVTALFAGPPGTGKSMAAEVIASDLGLDICRIDLAQVVSKYIGETEKNLGRIFNEAEQCGVVLVFDEADALFGKRSEVKDSHDRYANIETSYLLQRMERYRGLALLTTNLRANLDEAFTRRIGVAVEFPMPSAADRLRLWQRALGSAPCSPGLSLQEVAERLEVAGGSIVNAALTAAYIAADEKRTIDNEVLLRAIRWELQKAGRLMGADALEALAPGTRTARAFR